MITIVANNSMEYGLYSANKAMSAAMNHGVQSMRRAARQPDAEALPLGTTGNRVIRNIGDYGIYQANKAMKKAVNIEISHLRRQVGEAVDLMA